MSFFTGYVPLYAPLTTKVSYKWLMDEKATKNIPSGSDVGEIWTLGGPVWINFANSLVLASKGMKDVTGSAEALIWWLGGMGLSAPNQPDAQDLAFAASLRETFARVLDNVQAGSSSRSQTWIS